MTSQKITFTAPGGGGGQNHQGLVGQKCLKINPNEFVLDFRNLIIHVSFLKSTIYPVKIYKKIGRSNNKGCKTGFRRAGIGLWMGVDVRGERGKYGA